jgi:hypothetical protein
MKASVPALPKRFLLWALGAICVAILAVPAGAAATPGKMRVTPHPDGTVELTLEGASFRHAAGVLSLRIGVPVVVEAVDRQVSRRIARATPAEALAELVRSEGLMALRENGVIVIREGLEPSVTIDVKDGEIASILREVATQCGIRNLVLDREVQGKGTFLFQDVPCEAAFRAIFTTMGLAADRELNSLIHVRIRR